MGKPPKPQTAPVEINSKRGGTFKRLNLAMNAVGSQTTTHFTAKAPDH